MSVAATTSRTAPRTAPALRPGWKAKADRWHVAAAATEQRFVAGDLITLPASMAHAKEMGTTRTACGIWTYSWRLMLEVAFPMPPRMAPGVEMCPVCIGLVIGETG